MVEGREKWKGEDDKWDETKLNTRRVYNDPSPPTWRFRVPSDEKAASEQCCTVLFGAQVVVKEVEVEVEVESQQMAGKRQALENYSRAVEEQRNRLGQVGDGDYSYAQALPACLPPLKCTISVNVRIVVVFI